MKIMLRLAALAAVASLLASPVLAQKLGDIPVTTTPLSATDRIPVSQNHITGSTTPAQIGAFLTGTFQPSDADLAAIAALATQPFGRSLLTMGDAPSTRSALGLGTLATQNGTFSLAFLGGQPLAPNLNALSALTTAGDLCTFWTGSATASTYSCTSFGRSLASSTGALTSAAATIVQASSGDAILTLAATTAGTAFDHIDFQRSGGTVNAMIRHGSQISNDYGYLDFCTRGTDGLICRSRMDLAGYWGINTLTPQAPLDVVGSAIVRGNMTVGASGAAGSASPTSITMDQSFRSSVGGNQGLKFYLYNSGATETYGFGLNSSAQVEYHAGDSNATGAAAGHGFYSGPTLRWLVTGARVAIYGLPTYASDSAAGSGGLASGDLYKTSAGALMVKN